MGEAMRGLILSGGKGSRLRPLTYTGAKQLVPIANKPVLFYAIENLVACGIRDIAIVVSPETGDQVRAAAGDGARFAARLSYVEQPLPGGIAQAIRLAQPAIGDAPFVTFLGDNFLTHGIAPYVAAFAESGADASILLKHVPDARSFGVAEFEGERIARVVEKPDDPTSDLAVIGIYMFRSPVFGAIDRVRPSPRGELEITDTIQRLIDDGRTVRADVVAGDWIDTGKHDDLLTANQLILETLQDDRGGGAVDSASRVTGRVVLQAGCQVHDSIISGPAIIGERTVIRNAYIGPFSSIGPDCLVTDSEVAGSVIMEHTRIERMDHRIERSLIGRNVELRGGTERPRGYQMVLGDFSRINVS